MSSPRRRGRRDNGLDARTFRPLRDVDPRVGEHLLDVLRDAGIPAFLEPSLDVEPVTRNIALPSPPSDRLFVATASVGTAGTLVDEILAEDEEHTRADAEAAKPTGTITDSDTAFDSGTEKRSTATGPDDEQWRALVAAYELDHGPLGSELSGGRGDASSFDEEAIARTERAQQLRAAELAAEDVEEHYEPPPPPPLPILSRPAAYALLLIAAGAVLLIAPAVLGLATDVGFILGVLGVASGVGMLIYRMRESAQDDDDDGAIV